nr:hypothetical protein OG513_07910 [Streptomyces sp. NBC_00998]
MPRAALSVITPTRAGVALVATTGDATNGHSVANSGRVVLIVENSGVTTRTVTFNIARKIDGLSVTPRTETLAGSAKEVFGPFDPQEYGGKLLVDVDHADLKLTAIGL